MIVGSLLAGIHYTPRRAAYAVILNPSGRFAAVAGQRNYFLPGGGSLPDEIPEDTVKREVREELARDVRLKNRIGEVTQFFYACADDTHYEMQAVFFAAEFLEAAGAEAEHQVQWLPVGEAEMLLFHASHAWAVRQL